MPMEIAVYFYVFSIEFAESIFMKFTIGKFYSNLSRSLNFYGSRSV